MTTHLMTSHLLKTPRKKTVWLSAILALPPIFLATSLIGHPAPRQERVPAVAAYNEPPADAASQKPKSLARLFAALRDDAVGH